MSGRSIRQRRKNRKEAFVIKELGILAELDLIQPTEEAQEIIPKEAFVTSAEDSHEILSLRKQILELKKEKKDWQAANLSLGKNFLVETKRKDQAEEYLETSNALVLLLQGKMEPLLKKHKELKVWADKSYSYTTHLEQKISILEESKTSTEDYNNLEAAAAQTLVNLADKKTRQLIIMETHSKFVEQKQSQHSGDLLNIQFQMFKFPGGLNKESLPGRVAIQMGIQKKWFRVFPSGEVVNFLKVLEWRFCGIDDNGFSSYTALLEHPRDVSATDWKTVLTNGGAMGSWIKLQLDSPDGIWKLSVKGLNLHMRDYKIIAMEFLHSETRSLNTKDFEADR